MNAKLGGIPWMIEVPISGLMTVGYDVCHDPKDKRASWGAMVATMDLKKRNNEFFSTVNRHDKNQVSWKESYLIWNRVDCFVFFFILFTFVRNRPLNLTNKLITKFFFIHDRKWAITWLLIWPKRWWSFIKSMVVYQVGFCFSAMELAMAKLVKLAYFVVFLNKRNPTENK